MTRLHKLLYLADLEHYLETGRTITDATWVREKYGPMTKAMLPSLGEMKGHETEDEKRQTNSGREVHEVRRGPAPRFEPQLSEDAIQVLERILALMSRLTDDEVKRLAYATTPMPIEIEERRRGTKLIDTPIDFHRMTDPRAIAEEPETATPERQQELETGSPNRRTLWR